MLVNWVAHIHQKDGSVREITVTTEGGRKKEALDKVCRAAGITGPNDGSIRGLVIQEDRAGGWKVALGTELRESLKQEAAKREEVLKKSVEENASNVIEMTRQSTRSGFKRYRVVVYITRAQAAHSTRFMSAPTAEEALAAVLKQYSVSVDKAGDYLVYEMGSSEEKDILRLRRGFPGNFETVEYEPHHNAKYTPSPLPESLPLLTGPKKQPTVCCSNPEWCKHYGICDATGCATKDEADPGTTENKREEKMIQFPKIKVVRGATT